MVERTFELPDLGEGIAEGELVSWAVEEGESVEEDQLIAEVETDKALVEIPSPQEGTVKQLHYDEGEIVPVDSVIVTFEVEGDADDAAAEPADETGGAAETDVDEDAAAGTEPADTDADADVAAEATAEVDDDTGATSGTDSVADAAAGGGSADAVSSVDESTTGLDEPPVPKGRVFASPSTRDLARELGVDIGAVEGSGPGGRVSAADVRAHANGQTASSTGDAAGSSAAVESGAAATSESSETAASAAESADGVATGGASAAAVRDGTAAARDRTLAMPATRRLAEEHGVDLNAVPASEEREGEPFVTPEDVRRFAEGGGAEAAAGADASASAAESAAEPSQTEAETSASAEPASAESTSAGAGAGAGGESAAAELSGERVPYRGVRRTIGEQMAQSKYTAPHVSHHDEFDATALVELREELSAVADEEGVKLTYLPFVVKAITTALQEHPYLNSTLDEENEEIVLRDEYNVGIAVDTDAGLMVPVVKDADRKGLKRLAEEIRDLAQRARNRKIKPDEMRGGTFTITNIGAIGGEFSSPIINYPESAIFAMGPIKERPWVVDGDVVARKTMRISMSVDHRLVDGADAAQFSNRVKELLVEPSRLLLE